MAFPIPLLLIAGGAALLMVGRKKSVGTTSPPLKAYIALKNLAAVTGNQDFDPDLRPIEAILLEVQMNLNVEPGDGQWNAQTKLAIDEFIAAQGQ